MDWQFWIDVGGTFTDCIFVKPSGERKVLKWLSSGATKGSVDRIVANNQFIDESRIGDPVQFWRNYKCSISGKSDNFNELNIVDFDHSNGKFTVDREIARVSSLSSYDLWIDEPTPVQAIRYLLNFNNEQLISNQIKVRLGTTRGTNALLTRTGAKTAWVTSKGFADILDIGTQDRPDLFAVDIIKANPVHALKIEIDQRYSADGFEIVALDQTEVYEKLKSAKAIGINALAICLLHGDRYPDHEIKIAKIAESIGFDEICCSHDVAPQIKLVSRGNTTLIDAYLNPVLRNYVRQIKESVCNHPQSELLLMDSAGGLIDASSFSGKQSVLSGPAGGVVAMSQVAKQCGYSRAIGFDMGGTSTDVSRFETKFELEYETRKAGVPVMTPTLAIETVAAGGGSICWFDGTRLRVGPQSAGADPGPACYGNGGPLTITDINLFLGRVCSEHFPFALDLDAVRNRLKDLADQVVAATGKTRRVEDVAVGLMRIANASMAQAIRSVSIAKGFDPREHVLVAFGGAAGQHACAVANELSMTDAIVHPYSSLLSAYGMGLSRRRWHQSTGVQMLLSEEKATEKVENIFDQLIQRLESNNLNLNGNYATTRRVDLRYQGTDSAITVEFTQFDQIGRQFENDHLRLFGYLQDASAIEIAALRIEVSERNDELSPAKSIEKQLTQATANQLSNIYCDSQFQQVPVFIYQDLRSCEFIKGPALIVESNSSIYVEPNWCATVLSEGEILLKIENDGSDKRLNSNSSLSLEPAQTDPVLLEVMSQNFMAIARQMGLTLQKTAASVNVKERLDFSCALFRNNGDLVANAPHVPVHLGAMSQTVKQVIADNPIIKTGDVFVTNDPFRGGSHLPDITVISPVFIENQSNKNVIAFVACRAHHAEIGGISPGSMPPFSKTLAEEGVLIRDFKLFDQGKAKYEDLFNLLTSAAFPSRSPSENIRDVKAQVAANRQGITDLLHLCEKYSWETVDFYMREIQLSASKKMREVLSNLPDQTQQFTDFLDDGSPISVSFSVKGDRAKLDFAGTGPVLASNLNANKAIVNAAVIYCLRLLISEDIPLNQGVLEPVELAIPRCLINPPTHELPDECAAVVGGNVETSQRIVDALLGAFSICAASQGTMNNLIFGNEQFGYYETICGGSGASVNSCGASCVHTHMTNTRITDPEILETRFPVRLIEFRIREDSGGSGLNRGGNGAIRTIEFLDRLRVSLLTQRRGRFKPYGLNGGGKAEGGVNLLKRIYGREEILNSAATFDSEPGDRLTIYTPGGGGWGTPPSE